MRYREIIGEASKLGRVANATRKKADAAHAYQDKLKSIGQTTPVDLVGDRDAAAREQFQRRLNSADDALRKALAAK
jgi:hypothetical protein